MATYLNQPIHYMMNIVLVLIVGLFLQQNCLAVSFSLPNLVHQTMQAYFDSNQTNTNDIEALLKKVPEQYDKPAGVFVTLSSHGQTRACWGSIEPMHANIIESVVYGTINALKKDYRHKSIRSSEWKSLKAQVTVIKGIEPIYSIGSQNALIDGLLIKANNKSALLLPGEARDAYYQLVQCKLKAGIQKGETCQMYRIKAAVYE
jgi:AMMECR1 domain-containing protein